MRNDIFLSSSWGRTVLPAAQGVAAKFKALAGQNGIGNSNNDYYCAYSGENGNTAISKAAFDKTAQNGDVYLGVRLSTEPAENWAVYWCEHNSPKYDSLKQAFEAAPNKKPSEIRINISASNIDTYFDEMQTL